MRVSCNPRRRCRPKTYRRRGRSDAVQIRYLRGKRVRRGDRVTVVVRQAGSLDDVEQYRIGAKRLEKYCRTAGRYARC